MNQLKALNTTQLEALEIEGAIDAGDLEIFGQGVETLDSLDNFITQAHNSSSDELENIKVLRNYQLRNGDTRKSLFFIPAVSDGKMNLVILL